jgi:uncharacterized membrane protein
VRTRLLHLWEVLTSSYWFVPAVMMAAAVVLAMVMLSIDQTYGRSIQKIGWFYAGGADGARALLATIAASIITVAGIVFSITIATLTQASSQFGPRLLRNFMRDTGNQITLGTFVATFIFCVLILRSVQGENAEGWVPHASVTAAVVLSLLSIVVLIYFIHHVSLSLQAPIVVAAVAHDLEQAIRSHFPGEIGAEAPTVGQEADACRIAEDVLALGCAVASARDGYIQAIGQENVMDEAVEHDLVIRLALRPGDYAVEGAPLMHVLPADRCDREMAERLRAMFILGRQRTAEQDVEFAIDQLVEIAVRALSPAVNDPFTAVQCVDRLASSLRELAHNDLLSPYRFDAHGRPRVITPVSTWAGFVDAAFNQIRQYGRGSVAVTLRLLEVIAAIAPQMKTELHRAPLLRQAEMIQRQARRSIEEEHDLADVEQRFHAARQALLSGVTEPSRAHASLPRASPRAPA